jgi:hypothetical protein
MQHVHASARHATRACAWVGRNLLQLLREKHVRTRASSCVRLCCWCVRLRVRVCVRRQQSQDAHHAGDHRQTKVSWISSGAHGIMKLMPSAAQLTPTWAWLITTEALRLEAVREDAEAAVVQFSVLNGREDGKVDLHGVGADALAASTCNP